MEQHEPFNGEATIVEDPCSFWNPVAVHTPDCTPALQSRPIPGSSMVGIAEAFQEEVTDRGNPQLEVILAEGQRWQRPVTS